jgi:hypothetical protein
VIWNKSVDTGVHIVNYSPSDELRQVIDFPDKPATDKAQDITIRPVDAATTRLLVLETPPCATWC